MERRRVQAMAMDLSSEVDESAVSAAEKKAAVVPRVLLMLDQFGVCHAPHAQARSLLTEHDYGYVLCIVHDTFGQVATHSAASLVPAPSGDLPLTHEDFLKIHAE